MAGKPHHCSTLLYHLFKAQELLFSQMNRGLLQTVVKCNPWFPDKGNFDLEIWHQIKENVEQATKQGKNIPIDFWPFQGKLLALLILNSRQNTYCMNMNQMMKLYKRPNQNNIKYFKIFLLALPRLLHMLLLCQQAQLQKSLLCWNLMKVMLIFCQIRNCYFPYCNQRRNQETAREITCL